MSGRESREGNQVRPLVTSMDSDDGPLDCYCSDITLSASLFFRITSSVTFSVFIYEGMAYNLMFLARVLPAVGKAEYIPFFFLLFNSIWFLALLSYFRASMEDPGRLPLAWHSFVQEVGNALSTASASARWAPGKATFCRKCNVPRPERSHHCNVTGCCILRMDHFCPWINNCVGLGNYKFFLQLLIYGTLSSLIGIFSTVPEFVMVIEKLLGVENPLWQANLQMTDMMAFIVFEGMAIFLLVLLIPVLYTHVPLACSNRTAIENNYANMDNPYDLGFRQANLEQILGGLGYDWFIPMKPLNPQTDGISFLRKDDPASSMDKSVDSDTLQAESLWRMRYQVRPSNRSEPDLGPLRSISRWLTGEADDEPGSPISPVSHQVTAGCGP